MASGASRIFKLMQNAGTDTISEIVYLTVKSVNPLILNLENRLDITEDFIVLNDGIDKSRIKVGDKLTASTFNDSQCYFVQQAVGKDIKKTVGLQEQIDELRELINSLPTQQQVQQLANRISILESKI